MKRYLARLLPFILAGIATASFAAVSWVTGPSYTTAGKSRTDYTAYVTSGTDGTATGGTTLHGYIVKVKTIPGASVSAATYKLFDGPSGATATEADLFGGISARSTSAAEIAYPLDQNGSGIFAPVDGPVFLSVTGLGDTKTSRVVVTVQE